MKEEQMKEEQLKEEQLKEIRNTIKAQYKTLAEEINNKISKDIYYITTGGEITAVTLRIQDTISFLNVKNNYKLIEWRYYTVAKPSVEFDTFKWYRSNLEYDLTGSVDDFIKAEVQKQIKIHELTSTRAEARIHHIDEALYEYKRELAVLEADTKELTC